MDTKAARSLTGHLDESEAAGMLMLPSDRAEAEACRRRLRSGELVRPLPGLYARWAHWEGLTPDARHLEKVRALARSHPDWVFGSFSAALVHGLPVSYRLLDAVHLVVPARGGVRVRRGIVRHGAVGAIEAEVVDGVRVTPLVQTVADCLRATDLRGGLPIADAALARLDIPLDAFLALIAHRAMGRRGARQAIRTASWADPRAESGGESLARAIMIEEGFQIPDLQAEFDDPLEPGRVIRVDMLFRRADGSLVAGEVDGAGKYRDPAMLRGRTTGQALMAERRRESHINAMDIPVLRLPAEKLEVTGFVARTLEAFRIPREAALGARLAAPMPSPRSIVERFNGFGDAAGAFAEG